MNRFSMKLTATVTAAAALIVLLISTDTLFGGADASGAGTKRQSAKAAVSQAASSEPLLASSAPEVSSAPEEPSSAVPAVLTLRAERDPSVVKNPTSLAGKLCSPNAILIRLDDGAVLLDKNAGQRIYPASMTKIMTALLVSEEAQNLDAKLTIRKSLIDEMNNRDASMAGFLPDEQVSKRDLLYGVLLPSGAECCVTLAERLESTEQNFVRSMNMKAASLGLKDTHFVNTTGLHDPDHYSTVKDIALLLDYALKNDTFRKVFTTQSHTSSPTNKHSKGLSFRSTMARCLKSFQAGDATILGGKVGYTDDAGLCLASLAEYGGHEYILVTAGVKNVYRGEIQDAVTAYGSLGK